MITYSNLLDLREAANVFFPEFFVAAENLATERGCLLVLLSTDQVTEVLQTNRLT